ncbi:putative uncharacterized protein [Prevotella sp. CAG:386]|nr:hypothetical protein [Prevotella sp. CAG:386]CDC27964.1 putative uncharacterized protein [Prevotella sp. CAG:386]
MAQDCLNSTSTADVSKRLPNGIHVTGADDKSDPGIEGTPWGYLFIHNKTAQAFENEMKDYNEKNPNSAVPCFIHRTLRYRQKNEKGGVKKELQPSISGLVFLQGKTKVLQAFLKNYYPQYHLVKDRCKGVPASIKDKVMQPFMTVLKDNPERVTFLRAPFEKFAKDHVKLRVLTGIFAGCEGYIVRIDRDRQLVFDFGGYAVAIRGVHKEDFEVVEK